MSDTTNAARRTAPDTVSLAEITSGVVAAYVMRNAVLPSEMPALDS